MTKKVAVKKAIEAIDSGDARGLRKHIKEALYQKIRTALAKKEKDIAKHLIEAVATPTTKVKATQEVECEHPEGRGSNLVFKYSYETSVPTKLVGDEDALADYLESKDKVGASAREKEVKKQKLSPNSIVTYQTLKVVDSKTNKTYLK